MTVKLWILWVMLAGGVAYDLAIVALGFFPDRGLAERLTTDAAIAWFIVGAWLVSRIHSSCTHSSRECK